MIAHSGAVKLTDFGIAKAVSRTSTTLEGKIKGKVGYMSPEQTRGDMIDRRSDIFALGILLYEATTGARAFYANNDFAAMGRIARADFVQPTQIQPDFPVELEMIIGRALQKEPGARYTTAEQLQLEIEEFAHANGIRLSALELARHMKRAFGSPAHPQTDLQSLVGAPVASPEPHGKQVALAPRRPAWVPWVVAGAAAAVVSTVAITMWPRADPQAAVTGDEARSRSPRPRPASAAPLGAPAPAPNRNRNGTGAGAGTGTGSRRTTSQEKEEETQEAARQEVRRRSGRASIRRD